jgi:hypothetical protein
MLSETTMKYGMVGKPKPFFCKSVHLTVSWKHAVRTILYYKDYVMGSHTASPEVPHICFLHDSLLEGPCNTGHKTFFTKPIKIKMY